MENQKKIRISLGQNGSSLSDQDQCLQLLFEYEAALHAGDDTNPETYLEKCPQSEKERMITGLKLATLFFSGNKTRSEIMKKRLESGDLQVAKKKCHEMVIGKH